MWGEGGGVIFPVPHGPVLDMLFLMLAGVFYLNVFLFSDREAAVDSSGCGTPVLVKLKANCSRVDDLRVACCR